MQVPIIAGAKHAPTPLEKHAKEMLRYFILVIAILTLFVLILIVLYYTRGNSVTIEHVKSLAPYLALRA